MAFERFEEIIRKEKAVCRTEKQWKHLGQLQWKEVVKSWLREKVKMSSKFRYICTKVPKILSWTFITLFRTLPTAADIWKDTKCMCICRMYIYFQEFHMKGNVNHYLCFTLSKIIHLNINVHLLYKCNRVQPKN